VAVGVVGGAATVVGEGVTATAASVDALVAGAAANQQAVSFATQVMTSIGLRYAYQ
jgi:hypothetical protein